MKQNLPFVEITLTFLSLGDVEPKFVKIVYKLIRHIIIKILYYNNMYILPEGKFWILFSPQSRSSSVSSNSSNDEHSNDVLSKSFIYSELILFKWFD